MLHIKDIFPSKAQFKKGEEIEIVVELEKDNIDSGKLLCKVYKLHEIIMTLEKNMGVEDRVIFKFKISCTDKVMSGYGVEVELYNNNQLIQTGKSAFDILDSWKLAPRYGFLSDFSKEDIDDIEDIKEMNKYHLNVVQYYDWMYRHHNLIPPAEEFIDPLNRKLNLKTVRNKINAAHYYGMEAMGYGAVYAAAPDFYNEHKELGLYKNSGEAFGFSNFLYMMDISRDSKWHDHIISEFYKAVKFGFDGIHMDQYGYPKEAFSRVNGDNIVRNLRKDFPLLINDTRKYIEGKGKAVSLIFNAVNNWPVETVAKAEQDSVYIEVWPPNDTYQDLYNLISNAKKYAPEKQVILAAYIKPFLKELSIPIEYAENAALLTMAVIFASGGFHLFLGEKNGVLDDSYYPNYRVIENDCFKKRLRSYYDFIVRYEELLFDYDLIDTTMVNTGGINGEYIIDTVKASPKVDANSIWTLVKEKPGYKIINLVNLTNIENMNWNEPKASLPSVIKNIEITMLTCHEVKGIYVTSPDITGGNSVKLKYDYVYSDQGNKVKINVPELRVWDLIYIEY